MKIKATDGYVFERTEQGKKIHLRRTSEPNFLCNSHYNQARIVKGPIDTGDLCSNCYDCSRGYAVVRASEPVAEPHVEAMPVQDPVKMKLHEYECRAKNAEDELAELKKEVEMKEERDRCQKCGVQRDKVNLVSSEHYHSICNPCLEELHQREFSQSSCTGECDHLQFEYEQANEMLCEAQTRIEELEAERDEARREANEIENKRQRLAFECNELRGSLTELELYVESEDQVNTARINELELDLEQSHFESASLADELRRLEFKLDAVDSVSEWDSLQKHLRIVGAKADEYHTLSLKLRKQVEELEEANDELNEDDAQMAVLLCDYCEATKGHTLDNILTIMETMPPAKDLEGYELHLLPLQKGDDHWNEVDREWTVQRKEVEANIPVVAWIRTPSIEYIPTKEITDALCEELGRIPCEVRLEEDDWMLAELVQVHDSANRHPFGTKKVMSVCWFTHCRIKKSTIDNLRAKKND